MNVYQYSNDLVIIHINSHHELDRKALKRRYDKLTDCSSFNTSKVDRITITEASLSKKKEDIKRTGKLFGFEVIDNPSPTLASVKFIHNINVISTCDLSETIKPNLINGNSDIDSWGFTVDFRGGYLISVPVISSDKHSHASFTPSDVTSMKVEAGPTYFKHSLTGTLSLVKELTHEY